MNEARIVGNRPWVLVALLLAGVVHIVSILIMPHVAPDDAFKRLSRGAKINSFRALPEVSPGSEVLPYADPALATGACVYDLSEGPLHLYATVKGGMFMSLSFHSRHDRVFYAMTDKAATRRLFDVVVATPSQLEAIKAKDNPDDPPQELRLVSPERTGFVYARTLMADPSDRKNAIAQIQQTTCEIDREAVR